MSLRLKSRCRGSQAATAEHTVEGFLELLAGARVDYGVNAAVQVTQPESYLEDGFRRLPGREDGSLRIQTNR